MMSSSTSETICGWNNITNVAHHVPRTQGLGSTTLTYNIIKTKKTQVWKVWTNWNYYKSSSGQLRQWRHCDCTSTILCTSMLFSRTFWANLNLVELHYCHLLGAFFTCKYTQYILYRSAFSQYFCDCILHSILCTTASITLCKHI